MRSDPMERFILKKLLDWKNSPYRKPLILKGACVKIGLNQDTLVIDYYHPAVHYPNRVNYYALMAICDVARKKYGI